MSIRLPDIQYWDQLSERERTRLLQRPTTETRTDVSEKVRNILRSVRKEDDGAVFKLTQELDGAKLIHLEVSPEEWQEANRAVTSSARQAIERAARQIETFHRALIPAPVRMEVSPGLTCGKIPRAIQRVGLYVPGGSASLPSTALMLGIPSGLAGCPLRILCSPPDESGRIDPHILEAARVCGIERVFKLGGAQAIAAMAYGTATVPKVDKIFGPGNAWVTEAKLQVANDPDGAAIDMPAGPSEIFVIADRTATPEFVAADLLSQAEHGPDSQTLLISNSIDTLEAVRTTVVRQLETLPRKTIAVESMGQSRFILVANLEIAMQVANAYAPEHLLIQVDHAESWLAKVINAGSVFVGSWSSEALGDYASGTNHVLPTYGFARAMGGISVDSFIKQITFQTAQAEAIRDLGPTVEILATIEGLEGHRRAIAFRRLAIGGVE